MVGTSSNCCPRINSNQSIKDLNLAITVITTFERADNGLRRKVELLLAYRASDLLLSYNSHQQPSLFLALM